MSIEINSFEEKITEDFLKSWKPCTNLEDGYNILATNIKDLPPDRIYHEVSFTDPMDGKYKIITEAKWMEYKLINMVSYTDLSDNTIKIAPYETWLKLKSQEPTPGVVSYIDPVDGKTKTTSQSNWNNLKRQWEKDLKSYQNNLDVWQSGSHIALWRSDITSEPVNPFNFPIPKLPTLNLVSPVYEPIKFHVNCYDIDEYVKSQIFAPLKSLVNPPVGGFAVAQNPPFSGTIDQLIDGNPQSIQIGTRTQIPKDVFEEAIRRSSKFYDIKSIYESIRIIYDYKRGTINPINPNVLRGPYEDIKTVRREWNNLYENHKLDPNIISSNDADQFDAVINMDVKFMSIIDRLYMPKDPTYGDSKSQYYKTDRKEIRDFFNDQGRYLTLVNIDLLIQFVLNKIIKYYNKLSDLKRVVYELKMLENKHLLADNVYKLKSSNFFTTDLITVDLPVPNESKFLLVSQNDYENGNQLKNLLSYFFGIYSLTILLDNNPKLERVICFYFQDCKLPISKSFLEQSAKAIVELRDNYIIFASRSLAELMIKNYENYPMPAENDS